ncbi:hypothetical protein I350_07588 [Cryptococcus amylolentus CBS 6273]|uniref:Linalool dehydratase/isomerase domain-containing protein n=1 Tax=Cryptococcus amylolentus CBS 6273 TaxID=1296118 RepID=A0A1E3JDG8_9TREE|nr:hypothetical protein I350_07588 [Cryptococcus amylolentus CBS 6273]
MRLPRLALAALPLLGSAQSASFPSSSDRSPLSLAQYEQEVFDVAMQLNDWAWESSTGWVQADDDKGHTSTRFTVWYAVGLLHRNEKDDLSNAIWAIENVISLQYVDTKSNNTPWYWDYKLASDIPDPNPDTFPAEIYESYDPNWTYFIGIQFIQIIEEFSHLLPASLLSSMEESTYRAARHLMARVGYDGDNLVTAYSNPAIGRALIVSWVGERRGDANLTRAGERYGRDVWELFTAGGHDTLGEYNAPTYYGDDVLGLLQWVRHAPSNSSLPEWGRYILHHLWEDIAQHYNHNLKNMVGPYDRVYHRNMLIDHNIITVFFWILLGRPQSPVAPVGMSSSMYDLRQGAAFALVGQTLKEVLEESTIRKLVQRLGGGEGDRVFERRVRVSLDNGTERVNSVWMNENVMAGGQQVAEEFNRGPQFTPLILHWKSGTTSLAERPYVSFFQLYATASTINATVTPWHVSVSYPNRTEGQEGTGVFQYLIGDIPAPFWKEGNNVSYF